MDGLIKKAKSNSSIQPKDGFEIIVRLQDVIEIELTRIVMTYKYTIESIR